MYAVSIVLSLDESPEVQEKGYKIIRCRIGENADFPLCLVTLATTPEQLAHIKVALEAYLKVMLDNFAAQLANPGLMSMVQTIGTRMGWKS